MGSSSLPGLGPSQSVCSRSWETQKQLLSRKSIPFESTARTRARRRLVFSASGRARCSSREYQYGLPAVRHGWLARGTAPLARIPLQYFGSGGGAAYYLVSGDREERLWITDGTPAGNASAHAGRCCHPEIRPAQLLGSVDRPAGYVISSSSSLTGRRVTTSDQRGNPGFDSPSVSLRGPWRTVHRVRRSRLHVDVPQRTSWPLVQRRNAGRDASGEGRLLH